MSRLLAEEFLVGALIRDRRCMDLSGRVRLDLGSLLEVLIIVLFVQPLMPESVSLLLLLLTVMVVVFDAIVTVIVVRSLQGHINRKLTRFQV